MIVIAYYTPGFGSYEAEAELLQRSMERVGVRYQLEPVANGGDWYANTAGKADFIMRKRADLSGPLLYVDVDAVFHEDPSAYFDRLGEQHVDFGAHYFAGPSGGYDKARGCACLRGEACDRPHRLLSGTLFWGDTPGAYRLLAAWKGLNDVLRAYGGPQGGGQKNLWYVTTCLDGLKVAQLPGRYCRVFDKPWAYGPLEPVVIEHTIASREHRGPSLGKTNNARQQRLEDLRAEFGVEP